MEKQAFYTKMTEVAKCLNMKMEEYVERHDNFCCLVGENDIKIAVSNGDYPKNSELKLRIYSCYPRSKFSGALWDHRHSIEIHVSALKTPQQIAKDITNRFLPQYLQNLDIVKKWNTQSDEYVTKKANAIKEIADHFGWELSGQDKNYCYIRPVKEGERSPFEGLHMVEAYSDNKVKFELEVSPEIAIKIIELLRNCNVISK